MKIYYDDVIDFDIYIIISNNGHILKCFGNEDNAYSYAIRHNFNLIEKNINEKNKYIFDELEEIDRDITRDYKEKLNIINNNWNLLIKDSDDLVNVQRFVLDTNDIYT